MAINFIKLKNICNTDRLYYIYSIFKNLVFQRGIFMLFLAERGITVFEIGVLQASLFLSNVTTEVVAGMFGDLFGRKKSMLVGLLLSISSALGLMFSHRFIHFEMCFIIEGLAMSFISGSDEALLYDQLLIENRKSHYIRVLSRARSLCYYSFAASTLLGGFMYKLSWNVVYGAFSLSTSIALVTIMLFEERYVAEKRTKWVMTGELMSFLKTPAGRHVFQWMLLFAMFDSLLLSYFMYSQRTFSIMGFDGTIIAAFFTVSRFTAALAYEITPKLSKRFASHTIMSLSILVGGLLLLLHICNNRYLVIAIFFTVMLMPNILDAILSDHLNKFIPSEIRASVLSVKSMCEGFAAAMFYLVVGAILNSLPVHYAVSILSVIPFICFMVVLIQKRRWYEVTR